MSAAVGCTACVRWLRSVSQFEKPSFKSNQTLQVHLRGVGARGCLHAPKGHGAESQPHLEETGPLSQGVQEGRQALRILVLHGVHGMEVHRKKPRGFK